ncbi:cytochrome c/c1 heme-lyase [Cercophora scortea]|uniref:Holocytochrome c-type synthase n=1 Tax=Cercophora scortea TaxID=314031 RepID=A0AAE0I4B9_9PEZI|nr:cytochrome c/c1 heme-lyase [Cercophora scortea]
MHTDLLDTILVTNKDSTASLPRSPVTTATATATETASTTAAAAAAMKNDAPSPSNVATADEAKCPVDHKTRETWIQQARAAAAAAEASASGSTPATALPPSHPAVTTTTAQLPSPTPTPPTTSTWASWSPFRLPFTSPTTTPSQQPPTQVPSPSTTSPPTLDDTRVISSIPRSSTPGPSACPSNSETETGASPSGKWIYPSERQFFDAMKRKGHTTSSPADMKTVVPIHNAVNERAWAEILAWEAPYADASKSCGGPRLHSFEGLSTSMSPKARINSLLGYTAPFDRHDWVVDRCGTRVEYVIDFYAGRNDGVEGKGKGKLNFYLDVRPKLNTWEGVKMRALRGVGLV